MKTLRRRRILFSILLLGGALIGVLLWVWIVEIPRRQLTGQCMANLSLELCLFIDREGRMPRGMDELIAPGQIQEVPGRPGAFRTQTHELFYLEDVIVAWGERLEEIKVGEKGMVDRDGKPVHLMSRRIRWNAIKTAFDEHSSGIIYRAYSERSRAKP